MRKSRWFSSLYIWLVMAFLYAPIAVLIIFSFNDSKSRNTWTGFTLRWYEELFHDRVIMQSFLVMLVVAIVSSVIATVLGTLAAIGLDKMNKKLRSVVMTFTYLPMINPEIITGVALMLLFIYLKMEFGMQTLIVAHITFNVPYVILNVLPKLRQMDKNTYDAALDLGCNPLKAFTKVVIPEIMPGIVSGFFGADIDAGFTGNGNQQAFGCAHTLCCLSCEVEQSGSVNQIDLGAAPGKGGNSGANRYFALDFFWVKVTDGIALRSFSQSIAGACFKKQSFCQ